jgi:predicted MFS family arabinose efflux permease
MAIPAGTVAADIIAARLLPTRRQRRVVLPAALLVFAPLAGFAALPGLAVVLGLLVISGLGSAWGAGIDGLLVEAAPGHLRSRALAVSSAGLMFTQGIGFGLWGVAGQFVPLAVVIPAAAVLGVITVVALRPSARQRRHRLPPVVAAPVARAQPEAPVLRDSA